MRRVALITFACLVWTSSVWSEAAKPIVRAAVQPAEVLVGESVQLRITVLVPTWFNKPTVYPSFELANTITRLPADSSFNTSERVGSESWIGIVRDYRINPQIAARYEISGKTATVTYAHPDTRKPTPIEIPVPTVSFKASVPAGAEALTPFLMGTRGSIKREIEGDLDNLSAGDAVVVTVTAKLRGMPVMFLPELTPPISAPGLEAYAKEPVLEESEDAVRTERTTYIFTGGGEFTLPELTFSWWDTQQQGVAQDAVPEQTLVVSGAPAVQPATARETPLAPWWLYVAATVAAAAILYGLVLLLRPVLRFATNQLRARRQQITGSEAYAYRQLRQAMQNNDKQAFERWLNEWLARLAGKPSLAELSALSDQPLTAEVLALHRSQYGGQTGASALINLNSLRPLFDTARKHVLANQRRAHADYLAPLNPSATKTR